MDSKSFQMFFSFSLHPQKTILLLLLLPSLLSTSQAPQPLISCTVTPLPCDLYPSFQPLPPFQRGVNLLVNDCPPSLNLLLSYCSSEQTISRFNNERRSKTLQHSDLQLVRIDSYRKILVKVQAATLE